MFIKLRGAGIIVNWLWTAWNKANGSWVDRYLLWVTLPLQLVFEIYNKTSQWEDKRCDGDGDLCVLIYIYVLAIWKSQRRLSKRAWEDQSYLCGSQSEWLSHQQGGHAGASLLYKHCLPLCRHCTLWWPSEVQSHFPFVACRYTCVCKFLNGFCIPLF